MNTPNPATPPQATTEIPLAESPDYDARDYHSIALDAATNLTLKVERSLEEDDVSFEGDIFAVNLEARSGPVATRIGFAPEAMFAFKDALKGALDVLFAPGADEYVDAVLKRQLGAVSAASFNGHVEQGMDNASMTVTAGLGWAGWYDGRETRADELHLNSDNPSGPPVHGMLELKAPAVRELFRAVAEVVDLLCDESAANAEKVTA